MCNRLLTETISETSLMDGIISAKANRHEENAYSGVATLLRILSQEHSV